MKIVKVIIGLIISSILVSCHNTTADATRELEKLYPQCEIYRPESGTYIAIDSTGIYYIRNVGFNTPKFSKILIKKY